MSNRDEFRKSQGIVPFGVGSIVNFPESSLMMAGLDVWPQVSTQLTDLQKAKFRDATRIQDSRLMKRLSGRFSRPITNLYSPTEAPDYSSNPFDTTQPDPSKHPMPFVRFPNWHFCPRCRTLTKVPWNAKDGDQLRCSSFGRYAKGTARLCGELPDNWKYRLIPVRFAVACQHGHIMDFPWSKWAHRHTTHCGADSGELFLVSTASAGLRGVKIACGKCKAGSTLQGAFGISAFDQIWSQCPGERPWLGQGPESPERTCTAKPVTIQRGAANAYFPQTVNSILIPPYSETIKEAIDGPLWNEIKSLLPDPDTGPVVDGEEVRLPKHLLQFLHTKAETLGIPPDSFVEAVKQRIGVEQTTNDEDISESEYRLTEYRAFHNPRPVPEERRNFDLIDQNLNEYDNDFRQYFDKIALLPKLRETRVLVGFSRVLPLESDSTDNLAQLSIRSVDWLPATEVRGEGLFFVLNRTKVDSWLTRNKESLASRVKTINTRLVDQATQRNRTPKTITPEYLLVHSFSHALIRQLTFDCGYDSSSLRERLYISDPGTKDMVGVLIYTASGDSEGTLGGLVRQGKPGKLENTFRAAIQNSSLCSSDPLCSESLSQGVGGLNLAACHACMLLPETSCEEGNRMMDRVTLIGNDEQRDIGFFKEGI